MAWSLIASLAEGSANINNYTTSALDTTGANLIVAAISWHPNIYGTGLLSDSKGNTWTGLTQQDAFFAARGRLFYCLNPTVGSGHTFSTGNTNGQYPSIGVLAWSGAHASSSYANENGAGGNSGVTSRATGSVTPPENNCLVVAGLALDRSITTSSISINNSFTALSRVSTSSSQSGVGIAYLVQGTAAAINPTWSWSGSSAGKAMIASFKGAAASGNPWNYYAQL